MVDLAKREHGPPTKGWTGGGVLAGRSGRDGDSAKVLSALRLQKPLVVSVGKGGALAALIACWAAGVLYTCVAMIDSEVTSTVAAPARSRAEMARRTCSICDSIM